MKTKHHLERIINYVSYLFSRGPLIIKENEMTTLLKLSTTFLCIPMLTFLKYVSFSVVTAIYIWIVYIYLENPCNRVKLTVTHATYLDLLVWTYIVNIVEYVKRTEILRLITMTMTEFKDFRSEGTEAYQKILDSIFKCKIYFGCALVILAVSATVSFKENFRDLYFPLAVAERKLRKNEFKWFTVICVTAFSYSLFAITCIFGIFTYFALQFSAQMELLNASMKRTLNENFEYKVKFELVHNADYQKKVADQLRKCIDHHIVLKTFMQDLNSCMGPLTLVYYYISIVFLATSVYDVMLYFLGSDSSASQLLRPICALFGVGIYNLIIFFFAFKFTKLTDVWYYLLQQNYWYLWNQRNKRTYRLLLLLSLKPLIIRVGETFVLDSTLSLDYLNKIYVMVTALIPILQSNLNS